MRKVTKIAKSKRQQKETATSTDFASFSLSAAISEATAVTSPPPQEPQRNAFNIASSLPDNSYSQSSLATNTSFATAQESFQPHESITPSAASYFVEFSDEDTSEGLNFTNDPLAVLSRTESSDTPTEISFNVNPEETILTMSSKTTKTKKSSKSKAAPTSETTPAAVPTPPVQATAPKKDPLATVAAKETEGDDAHFDVAQNVYGTAKNVWAWGKTVPVVSVFLGLTETVAGTVVEKTIHMDLPAIDQQGVTPQLKKLDDGVVTPVILAIWKIIEPAIMKGDEMIVKPVMKEVVPRVLAPLSMFDDKKFKEEKKVEEEKKAMIDSSPTPEVVPALN